MTGRTTAEIWQRVARDYVDDGERPTSFAVWLTRHGGRPAIRALIRARQRHAKLQPFHTRASRLHIAYARKSR